MELGSREKETLSRQHTDNTLFCLTLQTAGDVRRGSPDRREIGEYGSK